MFMPDIDNGISCSVLRRDITTRCVSTNFVDKTVLEGFGASGLSTYSKKCSIRNCTLIIDNLCGKE